MRRWEKTSQIYLPGGKEFGGAYETRSKEAGQPEVWERWLDKGVIILLMHTHRGTKLHTPSWRIDGSIQSQPAQLQLHAADSVSLDNNFGKYLFKKYIFSKLYVAVPGLSGGKQVLRCGMWDIIPRSVVQSGSPALGAWNLRHWTTREVPRANVLLFRLWATWRTCKSKNDLD